MSYRAAYCAFLGLPDTPSPFGADAEAKWEEQMSEMHRNMCEWFATNSETPQFTLHFPKGGVYICGIFDAIEQGMVKADAAAMDLLKAMHPGDPQMQPTVSMVQFFIDNAHAEKDH